MDGAGKVFCIGLPRTGTTSFRVACEQFGLRVLGDPLGKDVHDSLLECGRLSDDRYHSADVFADVLISAYWVELSRAYPRARFVLTMRRPFDWVESMRDRFTKREVDYTAWLPQNRAAYIAAMAALLGHGNWVQPEHAARHVEEVRAQLLGKQHEIQLEHMAAAEDVTATLCYLLGRKRTHATPQVMWPHCNARNT
jgi:hypothetical protein